MKINREFFNNYKIKYLIKNDAGGAFAFYLKIMTSTFYNKGKYHVITTETAEEQLSIEFDLSTKRVSEYLYLIDLSGLLHDFNENERNLLQFTICKDE